MRILLKASAKKGIRDEKGYVFMMVLALLMVASLLVSPMLGFMATGAKTGVIYRQNTEELAAADAGVEDGVWQIRYDKEQDFPGYSPYDYTTGWGYQLPELVNGIEVNVTLQNSWIPRGLTPPSAANAERIILGIPANPPTPAKPPKVILTGGIPAPSTFNAKIQYYFEDGEDLRIATLGVWLPPGFNYDEAVASNLDGYYSSRGIIPHAGGEAIVWTFTSYPFAGDGGSNDPFPGVNPGDNPMVSNVSFQFTGPENRSPEPIAWIDTNLDLTQGGSPSVSHTWDAGSTVYKIASVAGGTEVEAYTTKGELRRLGSTIGGDYLSIGNTLMTPTDSQYYRAMLFKESSGTVDANDIPDTAFIDAAWLYWSGWIEQAWLTVWWDECSNFDNWTAGSAWEVYSASSFRGFTYGKSSPGRYLSTNADRDLSAYASESVTLTFKYWETDGSQLESSDRLQFQLSGNGGSSWGSLVTVFADDLSGGDTPVTYNYTIPSQYRTSQFRMRFYLDSFTGSNEYAYVDDVQLNVPSTGQEAIQNAKVNRVMFNGTPVVAEEWQAAPTADVSGAPNSLTYSCFFDATGIVRAALDPNTLSGSFTLGHWLEDGPNSYALYDAQTGLPTGDTTGYPLGTPAVKVSGSYPTRYQWTWAGWSLVIVYSSPETAGHQLYLFDTLRYIALDTELTFTINNFLAPNDTTGSHLTYFVGEGDNFYAGDSITLNGSALSDAVNPANNVFNSYSNMLDNPSLSGIDIDDFDVSSLIQPDDSSAVVVLDNGNEIYNLVYIILSFRSSRTTGNGTIAYLIVG